MKKVTKEQITSILQDCINRAILRVKKDKTYRPFHEALLTKKLVAASTFARSFSTSFGQGPIEEISKILAKSVGAETTRQKETLVNVNKGAGSFRPRGNLSSCQYKGQTGSGHIHEKKYSN